MKHVRRTAIGSVMTIALLLFLDACGGKQTVATKSAEAFREAQQKGTPMGGGGHGGHAAGATDSAAGHSTMTGMDPSTMTGMDHSTMTAGQSGMAGMDHSKMNTGGQAGMAGMDHRSMPGMRQGQPMAGMDHSKMQGGQPMAGMDHSKMQQGQQPMTGMDHGSMPGMQGAGAAGNVVMSAPTTSSEMQRMRPAATLRADDFDAPVPISVSEAMKATQGGGHEMRGITPGQDSENPPTPAPATRDGRTSAPAPAMDHSQHGQPAPPAAPPRPQSRATTTPQAKPAAATVYTCPMHPEVTSDKPGTCPKCGMTLVKK